MTHKSKTLKPSVEWGLVADRARTSENAAAYLTSTFRFELLRFTELFIRYYKEYRLIPEEELEQLQKEFQRHFPVNGRITGIRYYDTEQMRIVDAYRPKPPLPQHESLDWLAIARSRRDSYKRRLQDFQKGCEECEEIDFIWLEIEAIDADLNRPITNGKLWEHYQVILQKYRDNLRKRREELLGEASMENKSNDAPNQNFEDMFYKPEYAELFLEVLRELKIISPTNAYLKGVKGVFPLLIDLLRESKWKIIKPQRDIVYKDLLNAKIEGLNLSKDASEWRTAYKKANSSSPISTDMQAIIARKFSQISH